MKITSITKEKITSNDREIELADVSQVEVKKTDVVKTASAIYIVYIIFGLIALGKFIGGVFN